MARQSTHGPATPDPATPARAVPVLLTRPMAQSQAFAAALQARFGARLHPILSPLMAPVFLTPTLPKGPFAAVIFTSATGVEAAKALDLPRRAWCVGAQTAARARAAGFEARSADGDAAALVAAILADPPPGRLLHLRGEEVRGDVADMLNSAGLETFSAVVYRQDPQPLTAKARAVLTAEGPVIVPLFSPRTGTLFRQALADDLQADLRFAMMSEAVSDAVAGLSKTVAIARRPDADAMLDAVARLLEMRPAP
jgi:uroporphyrinogen-III synthase